jgi:hypothetical protein
VELCVEVKLLIENRNVVRPEQVEELAAGKAKQRSGLPRGKLAQVVEAHQECLTRQALEALRGLSR